MKQINSAHYARVKRSVVVFVMRNSKLVKKKKSFISGELSARLQQRQRSRKGNTKKGEYRGKPKRVEREGETTKNASVWSVGF